MRKTLMIGMMALVLGIAAYGAGPSYTDADKDGVCDGYVSRGNKTVTEAGETGKGQYRLADSRMETKNIEVKHMNRSGAPGKGKNRK